MDAKAMWYKAFSLLWKNTEKSDFKTHARQTLPPGIEEIVDLPYAEDGDRYHLYDAYYPAVNNGALPVIIDIHGGGWMYADKDLNKFYNEYLAARGFLVFSISYRLVPAVSVEEQLRDVCLALRAIRAKMEELPCDPTRVMLTGDSAGGMLAAYAAALAAAPGLRRHFGTVDPGIPFTCVTLTSPVAYMNARSPLGVYGRLMWKERPFAMCSRPYLNFNEILEETASLPPMLLITSAGDILALWQTRRMHRELLQKGMDSTLLDFGSPNGETLPHVFAVLEPESAQGRRCLDATCAFFRSHF